MHRNRRFLLSHILPQGMLSKIVALWEALHVPLIHRSRFYLAFRGRELFYFEAELRRLTWLQSEIGSPEDSNPVAAQKAKRALARSARKLDVSKFYEWEIAICMHQKFACFRQY